MALKLVNAKSLKDAGKVVGLVAAGATSSKAGGRLARLVSKKVDGFVVGDDGSDPEWRQAFVDLGGGTVLSGTALGIWHAVGKKPRKKIGEKDDGTAKMKDEPTAAMQAVPFVGAGVVIGAYIVPVGTRVLDKVDGWLDKMFADDDDEGGEVLEGELAKGGGVVVDLPAIRERYKAIAAERVRGGFPKAGGVNAGRVGDADLGGAVPPKMPGGVNAGRVGGAELGGRVAPMMPGGLPQVGGRLQPIPPRRR